MTKMKKENLSPKCDKPNMALSQIGDNGNLSWNETSSYVDFC